MALDSVSPGRLEHARAVAEVRREQLERGLSRWLPGGRQRLEASRTAAHRMDEQIGEARRSEPEDRHRSLPFVAERERYASVGLARERRSGRNLGRDLER